MIDPVELLKELIAIPSESSKEKDVVDHLEGVFRRLKWKPVRTGNNLHTILGSEGPLLLLNSHTDTVPVGGGWTKDPYLAEVEDGRIYGRGANDAKGCLAAMIAGAARAFEKDPPPGRICLAATCEEEISGRGLQDLIDDLPEPAAAIVGEPTGLNPAISQKGLLLLEITAKGRSAHAAWGGGKNAVHAAAKDIMALAGITFDRKHPTLGLPSLEVTQVSGGERHNVIPDRCTLVVDIRTTPAYEPEEFVSMVKNLVAGKVSVRSKRLKSVDTDPKHPIVLAALSCRPGAKTFGSPTVSDWVFLDGIPTIKIGPGDSRRSHTPDEYVTAAEVEEAAEFYAKVIRKYLSSKTPAHRN
jgi:acetylornithine deacetylase